jgi:transposase
MAQEEKYSIRDLKRDFPTEDSCLDLFFDTLHSRKCSCGGEYKRIQGRKQYQCSKCRFQIAPASTTIFHKSDTPLSLWFHAIFIFSNAKSGISAKEMERQLGVTYKCAWRILSQIRKALKQSNDPLKNIVETDVGYFGGTHSYGKNNERQSEVMKAKSVVMVAVERRGQIRAQVRPNASANEIESFVKDNVEKNSFLMTDSAKTAVRLKRDYERISVNHSRKEWVRESAHINTVETFFAHLKRSIKGTFKSVSKQHLQSYLDAFVFHYNNRYNDKERFGVLLGALLQSSK